MNRCGKLGLGTVQWGMSYGIANQDGRRPQASEIAQMLRRAQQAGVGLLDTAQAYGEAESIIGQHAEAARGWRVVTKTLPMPSDGEAAKRAVADAFVQSLARLKCTKVFALLVHHPDDLLASHGRRLWALLQDFKSRGLVTKIGVSVYDPQQLEHILDDYTVDIVQLPFNIYDQRFLRIGWLERLQRAGVEVHARSAFLQGLLLMPAEGMPAQFSAWCDHHQRLHRAFADIGATPLAGSLRFCLEQPQIDRVIVGCETAGQLDEILQAATGDSVPLPHAESFAIDDGVVIDPRRWSRH